MNTMVDQHASGQRRRSNWILPCPGRRPLRQTGAVVIMFAMLLPVIIGFFGLALDLSRIYNRKGEMQAIADAVAISAAKKLNGTSSGISDAVAEAHKVLENGPDWTRPKYEYAKTVVFSEAAIKFSRSSDGSTGWLDATSAGASPSGLMYVKVDTSKLDAAYGIVDLLFIPVVSVSLASMTVSHAAVAGRGGVGVTPLAICAMSPMAADERANPSGNSELVEFGFRRGVSYDLMKLNPNDDAAPANFPVDPITPLGSGSTPTHFALATVGPHVCAGTMALPTVIGASLGVSPGFPIGTLYDHLNSRFDLSNGKCDPKVAPPDTNIRKFTAATISWMSPKPIYQSAATDTSLGKLQTIADLPPPNNQTPTHYGPLWVFARAVPWSSYTAGQPEPANGYLPFAATPAIWASLYSTGPGLSGYPTPSGVTTPYFSQPQSPPSNRPGTRYRRVLNVPLLECPVSGSTAKVLAIGKFFMTVPADSTSIAAEFAGTLTDQPPAGQVELYQ